MDPGYGEQFGRSEDHHHNHNHPPPPPHFHLGHGSELGFEHTHPPPPRTHEFEGEYRHELSSDREHGHALSFEREHGRHELSSHREHRHGEDGGGGRRYEEKEEKYEEEEERDGFRHDEPPFHHRPPQHDFQAFEKIRLNAEQDYGASENIPPYAHGEESESVPSYAHDVSEKIPAYQSDHTNESKLNEPCDQLSESVTPSDPLPQGRLVRIFCKENSDFSLSVERNIVAMRESKSEDEAQQWIKDASYGLRIKDRYGYPAFSLVNKKTRAVLKHANEKGQQVLLMDYQPNIKDEGILWSESQDFGDGFKTVRSASDTLLNLTVFEGHKKIRNGSALVLDTWHKKDHQLWKLSPLCKSYNASIVTDEY